ncbi:MAG: T9SS type A sorting domain-containing protein [Bacteroidetes bacterium]|nr:T9SS type A sorting domain-containing protein [Bacteroidota bacterium]MCW5895759.1 T9SS type A sorting domain-containing protein [Bacteroidota bacterium]
MTTVRSVCACVLMFPAIVSLKAGEQLKTLYSFGVIVQHGQPVYPLPSIVALGLYDPDPLLDLAYYSDGKVQVWRNMGNGTYGSVPVYEQPIRGEVAKLEFKKSNMFNGMIYDHTSWGDLYVTADGREEKIGHEQMQRAGFASLPQTATGVPLLSFHEVWRSQEQHQPVTALLIDDIDNDGKMELVYFYKVLRTMGDTSRVVVYEHVGNNQYVVDWDTVLRNGGGWPYCISDLDKNGKKEIAIISTTTPGIAFLECDGPGQYRMCESNIIFSSPGYIFKAMESDVNHNGRKEFCVQHSNPQAPSWIEKTLIYVAEFSVRGIDGSFSFSTQELARYYPYTFDFAVGQIDGGGTDEIVPAGGSYGFHEPVPVDYLWRSPSGQWLTRKIHTGLESGTGAVMFVNTGSGMPKFFSGAPGPIGHGSVFLLDYVADTTWRVVFADSSLRNSPLWVNSGILDGQFVVAGANTYDVTPLDTTWSDLHVYLPAGQKMGTWRLDSAYLNNFYFLDIDQDQRTDLIFAWTSFLPPIMFRHCVRNYESDFVTSTERGQDTRPLIFRLEQNYPNPFNPVTTIAYTIATKCLVQLEIVNLLGQHVTTLVNEEKPGGKYTVQWSAAGVPSGVYLYTLRTSTVQLTRKMLLIK